MRLFDERRLLGVEPPDFALVTSDQRPTCKPSRFVKNQCRAECEFRKLRCMKRLLLAGGLAASMWMLAEDKADVPYPSGFREWQHVKSIVVGPEHSSFVNRGGIHHTYANDKALQGYRTGKFPDGAVIVDEGVSTKDGEGQAKGITLEAGRRSVEVMVKNDHLYKETGGWGFQAFAGDERTAKLDVSGQARCHSCHSKAKDRDYVFSSVRK